MCEYNVECYLQFLSCYLLYCIVYIFYQFICTLRCLHVLDTVEGVFFTYE